MKRKLQFTLLGLVSLFTGTAMAQTDVTSTYIANPSFELSAPGTALTASVLTSYSSGGAVTGDPKTGIYGWTVSYSQAAPTYVNPTCSWFLSAL